MLVEQVPAFRHAFQGLCRRPGNAALPVLTLAIGIGAATAIFGALYAAMFAPLPYPEPDRLVMGRATFSGQVNPWVSAPDYYDYRDHATVFRSLAGYRPSASRLTIRQGDRAESVPVAEVTWNLFSTLGVSPAIGRSFDAPEGEQAGPPVAIISDGYWKRAFGGSADVLGRTLPLDLGARQETMTIVGVMPPGFRFAYVADVWYPARRNAVHMTVRRFHNWMLLGRLRPGVTLASAQQEVDRISRHLEAVYPDSNRNKALLLTPLQDALAEGDRPNLLILMAAVGVLLLVACADITGLLLSRGAARQTELAIRSALGATRAGLAGQLLVESLLMALLAAGAGLLLARWLGSLVLRFVSLDALGVAALPLNAPVLAFAAATALVTTLLVGVIPAWVGVRSNLAADLKAGSRTAETPGRALFRQALVALQVAMSVVLLVAASLLGRSLMRVKAVDAGFRTDRLLVARVALAGTAYADPAARWRFFSGLIEDLRALPGIAGASAVNMVPILDRAGNIPVWDADHPPAQATDAPIACVRTILPGYFETMGIPLVAGRDLASSDAGALTLGRTMSAAPSNGRPPVLVISQSVARALFPGSEAVGRRMGLFTGEAQPVIAEVVGVVGDVRMNSLANPYALAMYVPYQTMAQPTMRIVMRTGADPGPLGSAVRDALARRDRGLVLTDVKTMDEILDDSLAGFRLRAGAVVVFGAATLLLAMLGVYGVLAFTVNRRRSDIGVRIAMGASRRRVLRWVIARGMGAVLVGLGAGLASAAAVGRGLRGQLFEVQPTDLPTFAAATSCLLIAALAACIVPAWRAMHVDPIVALRAE